MTWYTSPGSITYLTQPQTPEKNSDNHRKLDWRIGKRNVTDVTGLIDTRRRGGSPGRSVRRVLIDCQLEAVAIDSVMLYYDVLYRRQCQLVHSIRLSVADGGKRKRRKKKGKVERSCQTGAEYSVDQVVSIN